MRVAVIGAGAAGLASARQLWGRHCVVVFERSQQVGGTWVYTDDVGTATDGLPVHSSMYRSLRTNLPKEVMGFPDYPIPEREDSYLPAKDILQFLNDYADHFDLRKYIKFQHLVVLIKPRDSVWDVTAKDLKTGEEKCYEFDAVMVCNGHYSVPFIPALPGSGSFSGRVTHSHDYRIPDVFRDRIVVVVGAGPSGMDIALEISSVTKQVFLSHHSKEKIDTKFPENVVQKPDILLVKNKTVTFADNSSYEVDDIFFCTGYQYSFPFLSDECGVKIEDNHVQPLYKHLINIDHPTMCFIGLPFYVCAFSLFDLQARYFVSLLEGKWQLPSHQAMLEESKRELEERLAEGLGHRQFHMMGMRQGTYYDQLAAEAGIRPIPPVLTFLHNDSSQRFNEDLVNYRKDVYRIIDENNFVKIR